MRGMVLNWEREATRGFMHLPGPEGTCRMCLGITHLPGPKGGGGLHGRVIVMG